MILWFCLYAQFQPQTNFNTEVGQYCWGKTKQNKPQTKNNNKTNQPKKKTENNLCCTLNIHCITSHSARGCLVDVPSSFLSPDLSCVYFFWRESNTVGLPIIYSPTDSNSTYRPFFTLRQGIHHPGSFWEKGHLVLVVLGLLHRMVCSETALCNQKKSKVFLFLVWETELLQSTACRLIMRSQEMVLAAGRWGSSIFVFLLSLSGIVLSGC